MNRRGFNSTLGAGALGIFNIGTAWAQQAPALTAASSAERERLAPLIEGARREGRMTYWDTVIQPETHDELQTAFRRHYGLPNAFRVNYTLTGTGALVTRIEQELAADRVTIDVAAIASPTWVFEKLAAGHIARYASPELTTVFSPAFQLGEASARALLKRLETGSFPWRRRALPVVFAPTVSSEITARKRTGSGEIGLDRHRNAAAGRQLTKE